MNEIELHDEGGTIELCSPVYAYARALLAKHDAPVVLKPCLVDGKPQVYCTAYVGGDLDLYTRSKDDPTRAACALGFLIRATQEVHEMLNDPNHPAREAL